MTRPAIAKWHDRPVYRCRWCRFQRVGRPEVVTEHEARTHRKAYRDRPIDEADASEPPSDSADAPEADVDARAGQEPAARGVVEDADASEVVPELLEAPVESVDTKE